MKLRILALCAACLAAPVHATVVGFDDITSGAQAFVPSPYQGLSWFNFAVLDTVTNGSAGFGRAATSPGYVAFNNNGGTAMVYSAPGEGFFFNSAYFTSAYREGLVVHVSAYVDNVLTQQRDLVLGTGGPQRFDFDWNADLLSFSADGGGHGLPVDAPYFAMDDFRLNEIPEPGALALIGLGLGALLWSGRRRAAE